MVQRSVCFLVVLMLMFSTEIFGQKESKAFIHFNYKNVTGEESFLPSSRIKSTHIFRGLNTEIAQQKAVSIKPLASSYYADHLGFFCRKELQLEKIIAVPVKFRLGSLAYVNYLEQKPNAKYPVH